MKARTAADIDPHIITYPTPCLSVGCKLFLYHLFWLSPTICFFTRRKLLNLISYVNKTVLKNQKFLFFKLFNFNLYKRLIILTKAFSLATHFFFLNSYSIHISSFSKLLLCFHGKFGNF